MYEAHSIKVGFEGRMNYTTLSIAINNRPNEIKSTQPSNVIYQSRKLKYQKITSYLLMKIAEIILFIVDPLLERGSLPKKKLVQEDN